MSMSAEQIAAMQVFAEMWAVGAPEKVVLNAGMGRDGEQALLLGGAS